MNFKDDPEYNSYDLTAAEINNLFGSGSKAR